MNMRSLFTAILCICLVPIGHAQEPASAQDLRIADPVKFDEWADIAFSDEKASVLRVGQIAFWGKTGVPGLYKAKPATT